MSDDKSKLFKLFKIDKLIEHLMGYMDTKIAITKIEFEEKLKDIITNGFHYGIIVLLTAMTVLFLNVGIAMLLNYVLESNYLGFLLVSCFYVIFVIIFVFDKNKKVANSISDKIFKNKKE